MTLRIDKVFVPGRTVIRLIGRLESECLVEIEAQCQATQPPVTLDLAEVTLVDVGTVRFLDSCEQRGIELLHCAQYIRQWMVTERASR